jgi:hypothetical protein
MRSDRSLTERILGVLRPYASNWSGTLGRGDLVIPQRDIPRVVHEEREREPAAAIPWGLLAIALLLIALAFASWSYYHREQQLNQSRPQTQPQLEGASVPGAVESVPTSPTTTSKHPIAPMQPAGSQFPSAARAVQQAATLTTASMGTPGTFAANCLLARRLAERGVKFIQLYHQGWDQHGSLPNGIRTQCRDTDQPAAALLADLAQRGLLDETLVIWGGEFGRTNYSQGKLTATDYGRDHHPRCFSMWLAGGGIKRGTVYGETCPFGYNIVQNGVHVHDLHATLLHVLGIDHERLTFAFQGRDYRLTDVHGRVVKEILA